MVSQRVEGLEARDRASRDEVGRWSSTAARATDGSLRPTRTRELAALASRAAPGVRSLAPRLLFCSAARMTAGSAER
jgi:hypothetical protein